MNKKYFFVLIILILVVFIYNFHIFKSLYKKYEWQIKEDIQVTRKEWTDVMGQIFFRVKTANYLIDEQKLMIYFTCSPDYAQNITFSFLVSIYNNGKFFIQKNLNDIEKRSFLNVNMFENIELSKKFDILDLNITESLSNLKMYLCVLFQLNDGKTIEKSDVVEINIKNSHSDSDKIFICSEMNYLEESDYYDFEWWIELNIMIGYDKIIIYNNSIPNNENFNNLFERNKDRLEIVQLNYLPNLVNKTINRKYFRHMNDLILKGEYSGQNLLNHGIEYMILQECIYSYRDQANLLFMIDKDETFVPAKLKNLENDHKIFEILNQHELSIEKNFKDFETNYLSSENCKENHKKNYLREYFDDLYETRNIPNNNSIYFPQAIMIKQDLIEEIMYKFGQYFNNATKFQNQFIFPIKVCNKVLSNKKLT